MKKLLASSAVLAGLMASPAMAGTITLSETQVDNYTNVNGGLMPSITGATLPNETLTKGGASITIGLFTVSPPGSSCNTSCVADQGNSNSVDRAQYDVALTLHDGVLSQTIHQTGYYEAKYFGSHLACDISGNSPPGQSDCFDWAGFGNTASVTQLVNFGNGDVVSVQFNQGSDWQMTPTITLSAVPGPIAGAGLPGLIFAGVGFLAWRRRRQMASNNLAAA
jgi:hypothetical protein